MTEKSEDALFYSKETGEKEGDEIDNLTDDQVIYLTEVSQLINPTPSGQVTDGRLAIRFFSFPSGILCAVVAAELRDSFILILPYIMRPDEESGSITMAPLTPSSISRVYKSSIGACAIPEGRTVLPYLSVLQNESDRVPGFFNEMRLSQIDNLIIKMKQLSKTGEDSPESRPIRNNGSLFTPEEFLVSRTKH